MIGGNIKAVLQIMEQVKDSNGEPVKNAIGEAVMQWQDVQPPLPKGFLDLSGGDSRYNNYSAKVQESTHIFISDYVKLPDNVKAENTRMLIDGLPYDVKMIDDPMGLHKHLEIYLAFTGGL